MNLEDIQREEAELARKQAELRAIKYKLLQEQEEARKAEERTKPVVITAERLEGAMVVVDADYREDIIALYKSIPGRAYRGGRSNALPIMQWHKFLGDVLLMPNVSIAYKNTTEKDIERYLNAPVWDVEMRERAFYVTPGPMADRYRTPIPGEYKWESKVYEVALGEAVNLWEVLKDVEGVVWSEDAIKFIVERVASKTRLDEIALLKVVPEWLDVDLNGNKPMDFQTIVPAFQDARGGSLLIADDTGLGKTLESLLYAIKHKKRTLIVCPAMLKMNWYNNIRKFCGSDVKIRVLSGALPNQTDMVELLTDHTQFTIINYDILGRSTEEKQVAPSGRVMPSTYRYLWSELLAMCGFEYLIVDEAHYIKNTDSNRSQAVRQLVSIPHRALATATPVINRPGELQPILYMVDPVMFPSNMAFVRQYTYDGKRPRIKELREVLKSVMIRRLKKDVMPEAPKLRYFEQRELSPEAINLYRKAEAGTFEVMQSYTFEGEDRSKQINNALVLIGRLKQLCAMDMAEQTADKATECYEQTDESERRKVLIYSHYKESAYRIYQLLADQGALCTVEHVAGSTYSTVERDERAELVEKFQTDPEIKYLISTEGALSEGMDITAAGYVLFNDLFWTPKGHLQCEGRAHGRLNDFHGISSYYMVAVFPETEGGEETVGNWGQQLLMLKEGIINQTVEKLDEERMPDNIGMAMIDKMKEKMKMVWRKK